LAAGELVGQFGRQIADFDQVERGVGVVHGRLVRLPGE
jgi:hypothetical protein